MEFDVSHQGTDDSRAVHAARAVRSWQFLVGACWIIAPVMGAYGISRLGMTGYAAAAVIMQWVLPPCTALAFRKRRIPLLEFGSIQLIVGSLLVAATGCAVTFPTIMQLTVHFPMVMGIWELLLGGSGLVLWNAVVRSGEGASWMVKVVALVLAGLPGTFAGLLYFVLPHAISQYPFHGLSAVQRLLDEERAGVLFAFGGKAAIFLAFSVLFVQWSHADAVVMEYRDVPGDDNDHGTGTSGPEPTDPPDAALPAVLIIVTQQEQSPAEQIPGPVETLRK